MKRSSGCSNWRITVHSVRPPRAPLGGGSSQPGITVHHHPGTWTHQNSTERAPTHSGKVSTRTSPSEELSGGRPGSPSGGYGEVWTYRCSSSGSPVFCAYTWGHPPWSSRWVWSAAARESPPSSSSSHLLLLSPPPPPPPLSALRHHLPPAKHLVCDTVGAFTASPSQTPQHMAPPTGRTWVCVFCVKAFPSGGPTALTGSAPDCHSALLLLTAEKTLNTTVQQWGVFFKDGNA